MGLEKRIDPATLTDDERAERWKAWLQHTKQEACEFYAFRFKAENINKMFVENDALQSEGGASLHDWLFELHKTYCLTSIRRELEGGPHQNLISFLYEVERFSEREDLIQFGTEDKDFDRTPGSCLQVAQDLPVRTVSHNRQNSRRRAMARMAVLLVEHRRSFGRG